MLPGMAGSQQQEPKSPPAERVDDTTQPGLPLGEGEEVETDEHAALGDTEESTDEHAVPEQPTQNHDATP